MKSARYTITSLAIAAALGLAGCGAGETIPVPDQDVPATSPSVTVSPAPPAPVVPEAPEPDAMTAQLGTTFEYSNHLKVTLTAVSQGMATEYSIGADATGGQMWVFDLTFTNDTGETLDPVPVATASYGPDGRAAEQVIDSDSGVSMGLMDPILAGKKATAKIAFAIPTGGPAEVQINITPSFIYQPVSFVGTVGK